MKLENKKRFAAKVLGVGAGRIVFNQVRLAEIKEAMTRDDIRNLFNEGAIFIKETKGRLKVVKRHTRRRAGSKKQPAKDTKRGYMIIARKLRNYLSELKRAEKLTKERFLMLRQEIRASGFRNKEHLKERIKLLEAEK